MDNYINTFSKEVTFHNSPYLFNKKEGNGKINWKEKTQEMILQLWELRPSSWLQINIKVTYRKHDTEKQECENWKGKRVTLWKESVVFIAWLGSSLICVKLQLISVPY